MFILKFVGLVYLTRSYLSQDVADFNDELPTLKTVQGK